MKHPVLWPEQYDRTVIFSILTKKSAHGMTSSYQIQIFRFSAENNNISWCNGKSLTFQKPPGQIIGLISYPKSGNTWLRHLIQQSTGLLTGSFYDSTLLQRNGFPGEPIYNGSVIVIKSHLYVWLVSQNKYVSDNVLEESILLSSGNQLAKNNL